MLSLSQALLEHYDAQAPTYQTYPGFEQFKQAFGPRHYAQALEHRRQSVLTRLKPLSIYVHLPFCEKLCYFCNRDKIVTKRYSKTLAYLELIEQELKLQVEHLGGKPKISQLHLTGGTPTYMHESELESLDTILKSYTVFTPNIDMSLDIDPRTINNHGLAALHHLGFKRLNFGVQDCDVSVQRAVHRLQDFDAIQGLIEHSRVLGFECCSLELLYGLPKQTQRSFEATLSRVLELDSDRVKLTLYRHQPEHFSPQNKIKAQDLPSKLLALKLFNTALTTLNQAGYEYIGLDLFAKDGDPLSVAKRRGSLSRNFLGFGHQPHTDLMALGMSGVGSMGSTYSQNATTLEEYRLFLERKQLPVVKGCALSRDDLLRKSIIMTLMCQGHVSFDAIDEAYLIDFDAYFAQEMKQLRRLEAEGLVKLSAKSLDVTELGRILVRTIAAVFDRYWTPGLSSTV